MFYFVKEWFRDTIIDVALKVITIVEKSKNRCVAARLRDLAEIYDPE